MSKTMTDKDESFKLHAAAMSRMLPFVLIFQLMCTKLAEILQITWGISSIVHCPLFWKKIFHDFYLLWSMWCTLGAGAGVKNAFWCEIDFSTAVGHFFAPRHFSCPLENGPIRANCDKLWTSSPIHASEKKIPDHHIGKCHCQCWKMQAIRYK